MRGRARRRATGTLAGALAAAVLVTLASASPVAAAGTTVPPAAPPTLRGTIVPGTVIVRATTTPAPTSPRTNPPATAAPRAATTVAPPRSTVARTSVPATTAAPTTVATTLPPTTEVATTTTVEEVVEATTVTSVVSVGDAAASSRNSRIAWALAFMGVLVGALTAWFWHATRPVPVGMAGLAEMGTPRWWRADARKREQMLARSRKGMAPVDDEALVVPLAVVATDDAVAPEDLPAWTRTADAVGADVPPAAALPWADPVGDRTPPGGLPVLAADSSSSLPVPAPVEPPVKVPDSSPWAPPRTSEEAATAGDHG